MRIPHEESIRLLERYLLGIQGSDARVSGRSQSVRSFPPRADRVEISQQARAYQLLSQRAAELPDTRSERVSELRHRIEAGTYTIQGEKVAEGLVREAIFEAIL